MPVKFQIVGVVGDTEFLREPQGERRFWAVDLQPRGRVTPAAPKLATSPTRRLTLTEVAAVLAPAQDGLKALREGVASYAQCAAVCLAVERAQALSAAGNERGMVGHFHCARLALEGVRRRVLTGYDGAAWGSRTRLYFEEIQAISDALELHACQLHEATHAQICATDAANATGLLAAVRTLITPASPSPVQENLL